MRVWILRVARILATAHLLVIFGQPVFAGSFLSGDYDMRRLHRLGADLVSYTGLGLVLVSLALWLAGGPRWLFLASLLLVAGETAQYFVGMAGALDLHFPLGVALIVVAAFLTVAVWRPVEAK